MTDQVFCPVPGLQSYVTHIDFNFEGTLLQINTGAGAQHWCRYACYDDLYCAVTVCAFAVAVAVL